MEDQGLDELFGNMPTLEGLKAGIQHTFAQMAKMPADFSEDDHKIYNEAMKDGSINPALFFLFTRSDAYQQYPEDKQKALLEIYKTQIGSSFKTFTLRSEDIRIVRRERNLYVTFIANEIGCEDLTIASPIIVPPLQLAAPNTTVKVLKLQVDGGFDLRCLREFTVLESLSLFCKKNACDGSCLRETLNTLAGVFRPHGEVPRPVGLAVRQGDSGEDA
ncbi:hypothetical protein AGDE_14927 [Angomonas deanei]|uniref:Uncharacterized protein n=1 Tax=Angomonas deanei TaxID=59799 RepID=A0A7G2CP49_9TRYP|nr:hypothetical protein AGDE_14927 [Angomonas deanei]CAD2220724.1 hypothetical protein, conserved [Angomonas deanei]|eukprot:EPY19984.1 hypothetical protein AGDE_14927 [Angomonas deanei]